MRSDTGGLTQAQGLRACCVDVRAVWGLGHELCFFFSLDPSPAQPRTNPQTCLKNMFCNCWILKSSERLRYDKTQYIYVLGVWKYVDVQKFDTTISWLIKGSIFNIHWLLMDKFYPGKYSNFEPSEQSIYHPSLLSKVN